MFSIPPFSWIKWFLMAIGVWSKPEGEGRLYSLALVAECGIPFNKMEKHWNNMFTDTEWITSKDEACKDLIENPGSCKRFKAIDGVLALKIKHYIAKYKSGFTLYSLEDVTKSEARKAKEKEERESLEKEAEEARKAGDIELFHEKKSEMKHLEQLRRDNLGVNIDFF